jgi:hypothetical protein
MFRLADPPPWNKYCVIRLVLCVLIGCLVIHFIVEDTLLFAESAPLDPAVTGASQVNFEECEHLDDLVFAESLPGKLLDPGEPAAFLWITPTIQQARYTIFEPPKI